MHPPVVESEGLDSPPRLVTSKPGLRIARGAVLALTALLAWRWTSGERSAARGLRVVGNLLALVGVCWGPFELGIWRMRRLLRFGRVVDGHIVEVRSDRSLLRKLTEFLLYFGGHFHYGSTLRVRYRYLVAEDRWREVERALGSDGERGIGDPGDVVAVLVDPAKPTRHALYPTLTRWLRVDRPQES